MVTRYQFSGCPTTPPLASSAPPPAHPFALGYCPLALSRMRCNRKKKKKGLHAEAIMDVVSRCRRGAAAFPISFSRPVSHNPTPATPRCPSDRLLCPFAEPGTPVERASLLLFLTITSHPGQRQRAIVEGKWMRRRRGGGCKWWWITSSARLVQITTRRL